MDIAGLPKAALHLEGAIAREILLDLLHKYGVLEQILKQGSNAKGRKIKVM